MGPTATGKTEIAVELAKKVSAEIISCDSMLVYKEPVILVNKPDKETLGDIKHYMIGLVSVEEDFDVYRFKKEVDEIVKENYPYKNLIFTGGSGLYIKVILDGIFDEGPGSVQLRQGFIKQAQERGVSFLYNKLKEVDPEASIKINPNDLRRIIRALEVYYSTKKPISERQKEAKGYWDDFPVKIFGLFLDRKLLYERINQRTEAMFERGAVQEVEEVKKYTLSKTAEKILGISQINNYLSGKHSLANALDEVKKNTRRFAKRQFTWFRKDKRITWIDVERKSPGRVAEEILNQLKSSGPQKS